MAANGRQTAAPVKNVTALRWRSCASWAFLSFCAPALAGGDMPLLNTYWKLTHLGDTPAQPAAQAQEAHLIFTAHEQRVSGSSGCNRVVGGFKVGHDTLHLNQMVATRMACLDGMAQEQLFLTSLEDVNHYRLKGDQLELFDGSGTLARLVAAPPR